MMGVQHAQKNIFFAYSYVDRPFVNQLRTDLLQAGVNVWVDQERLPTGTQDWEEALRNAIRTASAVLLLASPNSRQSRYANDELRLAQIYGTPIYPFWIAGETWIDSVPLGFGVIQYLDARGTRYADAVSELLKILEGIPDLIGTVPTRETYQYTEQYRSTYRYDVALSYASEDRVYGEALARELERRNLNFFYDKYQKSTLWGQNLYDHLTEIYQNQSCYCIMLLSKHYASKVWTTHEREAAQSRALREKRVYILPIRLDKTAIPGILPSTAYLNWQEETVEGIVDALVEKLTSFYKPDGDIPER